LHDGSTAVVTHSLERTTTAVLPFATV